MLKLPHPGSRFAGAMLAAALACAQPAVAQASCGLCAKAVVIDAARAQCFLDRYDDLLARAASAVVVDLENCETDRGVVAALPQPRSGVEPPTLRFIASVDQLACIKAKLEQPDLDLEDSLFIDLESC